MDYTITVTFTSDDEDTARHLAGVIMDIAPYMVDNVDVTLEVTTTDTEDE